MLLEKGVDPSSMKFAVTEAGKPYIVREMEGELLNTPLNPFLRSPQIWILH